MRTRVPQALLVCLIALALAAPAVEAGYKTYGDVIDGALSDKDITHLLLVALVVAPGSELMFDDVDTNTAVGTTESVYVDADGSGTVTALDIRLRSGSLTKGVPVKTSDTDCCGTALTATPGGWGFVDLYPNTGVDGLLNLGEPVFVDLDNSGTVTTADIKITSKSTALSGGVGTASGSGSFANVAASDTEIGAALTALAGYALNVFDSDGNGVYGFADQVYIDMDADKMPGPGDLRISKPTSGSTLPAGTMPKAGERDTIHQLTAIVGAALAFDDADVNTAVGATEGIYLDVDGGGTVTVNDLRFIPTGSSSGNNGKQVVTGDTDIGTALTALPGNGYMFNDRNADGSFDAGDVLYIEMDGDAIVETGDLRIARGTGTSVTIGQRVSGSPTDLNAPLTALAGFATAYFDFNGGNALNRLDILYLDVDADGLVTSGDVRIMAGTAPLSTFGEIIYDAETEMEYCYDFTFAGGALAYTETNNPAIVNLDEPIYFDRGGTGTATVNDLRFASITGLGNGGTFVKTGNNDQNNPLLAIPGGAVFSWYDGNGDSVYSSKGIGTVSDAIYLDVGTSGTVTVGDVHVSRPSVGSASPGSKVTGSSSDNNLAITAFVGSSILGMDSNGDGAFTSDDALYLNTDTARDSVVVAASCVTPGDVRISGTGGGTTTGGGGGGGGSPPSPPPATPPPPPADGGDGTTTPPPPPADGGDGTTTPPPPPADGGDGEDGGDGTSDGEGNGTGDESVPALGPVLVLLAFAAVALRRRG